MTRAGSAAFACATDAARWLLTPQAVRARCRWLLRLADEEALHWQLDRERLAPTADYVVATIRSSYPDLLIPYHSRWRHFEGDGIDRWGRLCERHALVERDERARAAFDLALTSVLLDAGSGGHWRYREASSGREFERSEGLAVASFALFAAGGFSAHAGQPLRADAAALMTFDETRLASAMQCRADNMLAGLAGRVTLLQRLGRALVAAPDLFGRDARAGNLYDYLAARARGGRLAATDLLAAILTGLGTVWPGRLALGGIALGDCWHHRALATADASSGLVPLHKLSQWLAYSLVEPLAAAGIAVDGLDCLTALAEYRNGGLLVDSRVLTVRDPALLHRAHTPAAAVVVEWRALTVALLDELAALVRERLGVDAQALPLIKVLQGGTWSAGRRLARERRADGDPPLRVDSDGTVF